MQRRYLVDYNPPYMKRNERKRKHMNSSNETVLTQQKPSLWWGVITWLSYWIKALDYSAYEHSSEVTGNLLESITLLDRRVIAMEQGLKKANVS